MKRSRILLRLRAHGRISRTAIWLASVAAMLAVALPADGIEPDVAEAPAPPATSTPASGLPSQGAQATVLIDARAPRTRIPSEYLGLSFELSSAAQIAEFGSHGNFVALLRSLGPGVLRLGGASADTRVAWTDRLTPRPAWASSVLDPADLKQLRVLAQRSGWRVLLTIGLAHYEPRAATREAAAAKLALGPWLAGIEVGNEPDSYGHHALRALPWTPAQYETQVSAYRQAIAARTSGIPVAGPGVSGSRAFQRWGPAEVRRQHPMLLTGHHYPLRCDAVPAPTIEDLLSERTREKESESLLRFLAVSRASSTPFRMDETNTVSCGGVAGISDTFASALWAVSYIAKTMAAGATGINLQGNPANCSGYSPVCATSPGRLQAGQLRAQPEWYALLFTKALVGDRPLPSRVSWQARRNLSVSALRTPAGGLQFVIVEDEPVGAGTATLRLHVGRGMATASQLELRAPSLAARSGVTLGGRAVSSDGSFAQTATNRALAVSDGAVSVSVPAGSATLVTVTPGGKPRG
jgi:hypothetical protein